MACPTQIDSLKYTLVFFIWTTIKLSSNIVALTKLGFDDNFLALSLLSIKNTFCLFLIFSIVLPKTGISPIYEELNQRIKELDATEKSYEITDKTKEIQDRIDYLFSIIDTLNITKEEEDIVFISESLKNNNENIIWLYESKQADILFSEFDDINTNLNDLLDLENWVITKKIKIS